MSRLEQRNLAILVAVIVGLLVGVGVLANYTGILRADAQEQPKVTCAGESKVCTRTAPEAAGLPNVNAAVDEAPGEGCCSAKKAAGCCEAKPAGCCEKPPTGCCEGPPAGCCEKPKGECCQAKAEGATD